LKDAAKLVELQSSSVKPYLLKANALLLVRDSSLFSHLISFVVYRIALDIFVLENLFFFFIGGG